MRYLSPIFHTFPKVFCEEINKIKIEALAVYDVKYYKAKKIDMQPYLFMIIPYNQKFINVCRQVRNHVDDYPYNLEDKYIIVLRVPPNYENSYSQFLLGNYSKMYSKQQLKEIRVPEKWQGSINPAWLVLTKHESGISILQKEIKATYHSDEMPENPNEYDLPPRIRQEVFNWKDNEDFVRQNTPLTNL